MGIVRTLLTENHCIFLLFQLQEEILASDAPFARQRGGSRRIRECRIQKSVEGAKVVSVVRRHPDGGQVALQLGRLLAPQDRRGILLRSVQGRRTSTYDVRVARSATTITYHTIRALIKSAII